MGYSPNQFARSLGRRKTDTIGLMVSGIRNPFFADMVERAEQMILASGYQVFLDCGPSTAGSYAEHVKLKGWPVDGVLIWAFPDQTLEMFLGTQAAGLPVVYLGYERTDGEDCVYFDLYGGGMQAVRHLHERGYRKVAYITPMNVAPTRPMWKERAYRDFCREAGWREWVIPQERHEETRRAGLETALSIAAMPASERPDAVICQNDVVAQGVYFGLRRAGLQVPGDVAVVGFDGLEDTEFLDIPLTSVVLPLAQLCARSLELMQSRIAPQSRFDARSIKIETHLRVGGTT
jgi:LacI family transcriptional regulator